MMIKRLVFVSVLSVFAGMFVVSSLRAQDDATDAPSVDPTRPVEVADGALQFQAPKAWETIQPKINFIEAEFKIPRVEGDSADGRMTIMGAGGSVDQNIQRWIDQFVQPDGKSSEDATKIKKIEVSGMPVHLVDISGTFLEGSGGPFGPKTERPGYRMLAAIIETPENGNYFVKLYGPAKTIEANARRFRDMIKSAEIVD